MRLWSAALRRGGYRRATVAACAVLGASIAALTPPSMRVGEGFLYDVETTIVARLLPASGDTGVAVVALDADSLADARLAALPRTLMAPLHAKVLDGVLGAGASAVGFDFIFAWSGNALALADATLPANYDLPLLDALRRGREHVVLAQAAHSGVARPYAAIMRSFLDRWALGYVEKFPDADGVSRHVPLLLETTDGKSVPTLAGALLARLGHPPTQPTLLLAPRHHLEAVPSYGFAGVLRCAESDPAALVPLFRGKTVLIGTTLADEDRLTSGARFLPPPVAGGGARQVCPPPRLGASDPVSSTVAGVYLHAAAIDAALAGGGIAAAPTASRALLGAVAAFAAGWLGLRLRPWTSFAATAGLAALIFAVATAALARGRWLPAMPAVGLAIGAAVAAYAMRFLLEERRRRSVQRAFGHFLSPIIVNQLVDHEETLRLGGEAREISVLFADLSGFTTLSGQVGAERLMAVTNDYLAEIVAAVESTGGYVDKFIGDAVMAIWGAPAGDREHAAHAAAAALLAVERVETRHRADLAQGAPGYALKAAINSGAAVVGNVGAPGRYNYTAVGEVVNVASRLEGVCGDYGCTLVSGPTTAAEAAGGFLFCELDWVRLKGKREPIPVFELLAASPDVGDRERGYVVAYGEALAAYRAGRFVEAAALWRALRHPHQRAGEAAPPAVMAERAQEFAAHPPTHWDGVWVKVSK
jgi:class 3 adenylate cyclase